MVCCGLAGAAGCDGFVAVAIFEEINTGGLTKVCGRFNNDDVADEWDVAVGG